MTQNALAVTQSVTFRFCLLVKVYNRDSAKSRARFTPVARDDEPILTRA